MMLGHETTYMIIPSHPNLVHDVTVHMIGNRTYVPWRRQCICFSTVLEKDSWHSSIPQPWSLHVSSVAQFTTDDIGLIWLTSSNETTAALTYLRTLATNTSYGILGKSSGQLILPLHLLIAIGRSFSISKKI